MNDLSIRSQLYEAPTTNLEAPTNGHAKPKPKTTKGPKKGERPKLERQLARLWGNDVTAFPAFVYLYENLGLTKRPYAVIAYGPRYGMYTDFGIALVGEDSMPCKRKGRAIATARLYQLVTKPRNELIPTLVGTMERVVFETWMLEHQQIIPTTKGGLRRAKAALLAVVHEHGIHQKLERKRVRNGVEDNL